ncbi:chemotaxis protein CheC [Haladaptatus paucihalophilus DX253]|uniref:Chemotaxis protein CheC n=1 Tax=Haladaptatus paucihalophilus DX253 TaxID=797209 RepID=E7QQ32_HALPU|nr:MULTISPECIES: chemotaxis protein CheC [Haladaptatus]EFW93096.1 chemotaxis protein CheC [Haladaptatus paucihalophilus DX253]GKZ12493.1 chemotaxis protein [Haladaptatus sp. T7]SHK44591.1 chemotaxis protein CheC [Haladaptatus paucihalophilus DX253]
MSLQIDIRKLSLFNKMAKQGANTVANHLSQMTGMETEMEITKTNFIDIRDVRAHMGHEKQVGIHIELVEQPYGYILFLFSVGSAKQLAHGMMGGMGEPAKKGFSDMEKSAVQEIGNIMTSGFIDGWANVLQTTIDFSTPKFTYGPASRTVEALVGHRDDDVAMVLDSRVRVPDSNVEVKVYTFPELEDLVRMMRKIEV